MSIKTMFDAVVNWVVLAIGKVDWRFSHGLTDDEHQKIREMITKDYYIIMTRRRNHLSTWVTSITNFFITGKFGYWAHCLMNMEDTVQTDADFRLVESTGQGVHYSDFAEVFDVNSVSLMKPKSMSIDKWTAVMDRLKGDVGKPYDTLFDIAQREKLSCVELVRDALMADPDYATNFANFEAMIAKGGYLTPQMFYDCGDFEVVYEVRNNW